MWGQGIEFKDLTQNISYYGLEGSIWVDKGECSYKLEAQRC